MSKVQDPAVAPDLSSLESIPGLKVADGLGRVSGNARLYADLLRQFVERQSDAAERILTLTRAGDLATAERVAHTVKGVAGTIGADGIQKVAGELERAIREHADTAQAEAVRAEFAAMLDALAGSLKRFLDSRAAEEASDGDGAPPPDRDAVKSAIARLAGLLEDSDSDAIDVVKAERAAIRSLFTAEGFSSFERMVNDYSFDDAAGELRRAAAEKGF